MILYVDETGNNKIFIVAGLLASSKEDVELAYKRLKKDVENYPINPKFRAKVFFEFKSRLIDKDYSRIKIKLLENLNSIKYKSLYNISYNKKETFNGNDKKQTYINQLLTIVNSIDEDIELYFDNTEFNDEVIREVSKCKNVIKIEPKESFACHGIQFIDNICSVIRMNETKEQNGYYELIKNNVKIVDIK